MKEQIFENGVSVYVLARLSKGKMTRPVKVGIAKNPHQRAREINTTSPFKVGVVQHFEAPDREIASALEQAFHKVMRAHRLNGEWFRLEPATAVLAMAENYFCFLTEHVKMAEPEAKKIILMLFSRT